MKKSSIFWIIVLVITLLLISTLLYKLIYFNEFNKKLRPATDIEKQKAIEILKEKNGYEESQIKIGNVFPLKNRNLVQAEITINNSKKHYLVDTVNGKIAGR